MLFTSPHNLHNCVCWDRMNILLSPSILENNDLSNKVWGNKKLSRLPYMRRTHWKIKEEGKRSFTPCLQQDHISSNTLTMQLLFLVSSNNVGSLLLSSITRPQLLIPPSFIHEVKKHTNCFTVKFERDSLEAISNFMINVNSRDQWAMEMGDGEGEKEEAVAWETTKIYL